MSRESDYDLLLTDLYAGTVEPERMGRFLSRLCTMTGSNSALLLRQDLSTNVASIPYLVGLDEEETLRYEADFAGDNVWFDIAMPHLRTGTVHFDDDWLPKQEFKRTRYYGEYLRHLDVCHAVGMCGALERGHGAFLTFTRAERMGVYTEEQRALCRRLGPHWVNAYALLREHERMRAQANWLEHLQHAVFLLDRQFRWTSGNRAAELLLSQARLWQAKAQTALRAVHPATQALWRQAREQTCNTASVQAPMFPVHDENGRLEAIATLRPFGAASGSEAHPDYVLSVAPLHSACSAPLAAQLRSMFGLTLAEAELAVSLHTYGDLAHAAEAMGISASSARTRLQTVYDKTGVHRQSELFRLVEATARLMR